MNRQKSNLESRKKRNADWQVFHSDFLCEPTKKFIALLFYSPPPPDLHSIVKLKRMFTERLAFHFRSIWNGSLT